MNSEKINVKCPQCAQPLAFQKPAKPGMYQLTCSKCAHRFNVQLRGVPIRTEAEQKTVEQKKVKILGEPKLTATGKYRIDEPAAVGHPYGCICPQCKKAIVFMTSQTGPQAVKCRHCATMVVFKTVADGGQSAAVAGQDTPKAAEKDTPADNITQPGRQKNNKSMGMLTWGNLFSRKNYVLYEGTTVIGRHDADRPSDIELKDKKVSRRSVEIDVSKTDKGFFFKLTVLKATNPVYVNNTVLGEGESVYLKYGDCIQMGKTLVNFQKVK